MNTTQNNDTHDLPELTIFYDGFCPLCIKEMHHIRAQDKANKICLINLQVESSLMPYPELDKEKAMKVLLGKRKDGTYIEGLDVTHMAWSLLGKGHLTCILRVPFLRIIFDGVYQVFAKHRYTFSYWITGQRYGCEACKK